MNKMDQEPERDKVLKFVEAAAHSPEETERQLPHLHGKTTFAVEETLSQVNRIDILRKHPAADHTHCDDNHCEGLVEVTHQNRKCELVNEFLTVPGFVAS